MFSTAQAALGAERWLRQTRAARDQIPSDDDEPPRPMEMRGPTGPGTNPWHSPATFDRNFDARGPAGGRQNSGPSPEEALGSYRSSRRTSTSQTMAALAAREQQDRAAPASVPPGRNPYVQSRNASPRQRSPRPRRDPYGRSESPYFNNTVSGGDLGDMNPVEPADFTGSNQRYFSPPQGLGPAPPTEPMQGDPTFEQGLRGGPVTRNADADAETETEIETNFLLWWKHLQKGLADLKEMKSRLETGRRQMTNDERFDLIRDMKNTCDDLTPTVRQFRNLVKTNITQEKLAEIADKYKLVEPGRISKLLHDIEGLRRQIQKITTDVERDFRAMQVAQLRQTGEENERTIGIMFDGKSQEEKDAARRQLDANPENFIHQRIMNGERLNAANMTLGYAQERLRLAQELEATAQLVSDLMGELAERVECQDAPIAKMQQVTEQVEERVQGGNKHIDEGIVKGNKRRRRKWWCLLAGLLTLAIIGGILALYFLVIKKKGGGGGGGNNVGGEVGGYPSVNANANANANAIANANANANVNANANANNGHVNTAATSGQTTVGYPATAAVPQDANVIVARPVGGGVVGKRWYG